MAKELTPFSVTAPGSLGLNTKEKGLEIGFQFCSSVTNAVISDAGTIAAREGWQPENTTEIANGNKIKTLHDYIDSGEDSRIISAAENKIFEGLSNPSDVTGTITAPTDDHWKFVNFNGKCVGVQENHKPIVKEDGGDFSEISFDEAPDDPIEALSAWGRVWYVEADKQTIKYSDLLQEGILTGGSSGVLNLSTVWGNGQDEIVALQEFNNYLVIFGKKQIVLFSGGADPNNSLEIVDIVNNTGCIARDSVQNIGNDVLFLSDKGVISFARNLQAGGDVRSLPLANLTDRITDFFSVFFLSEPQQNIKSCFKPDDGYYLITFPDNKRTFYINLRYPTENIISRVFVWTDINPSALLVDREDNLYIGKDGFIGRYRGYQDNGESYDFSFVTGFTSGGEQDKTVKKIPKQAVTIIKGGYSSELTLSWSYDFLPSTFDNDTQEIQIISEASEYNISEYGEGQYSRINPISTLIYTLSGSGKAVQIGMRSQIRGAELEIQRVDLYLKSGKVSRRTN